jgi:ethanolamine utilization protein EutP (predicted NTPase)
MVKKLYAARVAQSLEPYYSAHVAAMTTEGLYSKSDIAAELAFRDAKIERLELLLRDAQNKLIFTLAATKPQQ